MLNGHLNEDAELFPLGVLDEDEARTVERHIAGCAACAARVADAELVAASLAASLPAARPSPRLGRRLQAALRPAGDGRRWDLRSLALAAGFALALAGVAWQTVAVERRTASDDLALVTIVHSHFKHVTMTPRSAQPVAAKVLYAIDGAWVYIIADRPMGSLHAVARTANGEADLGELDGSGQTATLLVRPRGRIESLELRRDREPVATATLTYEEPKPAR